MDQRRIFQLRDKVERVSVSTAVILLSFSNLNSLIIPMDSQRVKETIKKHIDILLQDFFEDSDLINILPSVAAQVVKDVNDYLEEKKKEKLADSMVQDLANQIESLEDPNQRIRDLLQKRIVDFCKQVISGTVKNIQVPPGLTICKNDLGDIAGQFVRLVNYNKSVFGEFYNDIIENHCIFTVEA
jgi:predicted house-cleaning noncanonical NTP pyrophosphatase (MazG superfamily)